MNDVLAWLTGIGTVVTVVGTVVTIVQARAASRSRHGAEAYFIAIASVRKVIAITKLCHIVGQARDLAKQLRLVGPGARGVNMRKTVQALEECLHQCGLNPTLIEEVECASLLNQLKQELARLTDANGLEVGTKLLSGVNDIHIALMRLREEIELPNP
ncbi:MAG: hypothetical protein K8H99_03930 [Nitrospirae bacterium]|nr:hypothetical protein [Fimbriimonadaceae bacterium]